MRRHNFHFLFWPRDRFNKWLQLYFVYGDKYQPILSCLTREARRKEAQPRVTATQAAISCVYKDTVSRRWLSGAAEVHCDAVITRLHKKAIIKHVQRKIHNNHILRKRDDCGGWQRDVVVRCWRSYLVYGFHCQWNWKLLWSPPRTEVGPLWLQKNKMKTDIQFCARHVCKVQIHENTARGTIITIQGDTKAIDRSEALLLYSWRSLSGMCSSVQSSPRHNGTTHSYPGHSLLLS